MRSKLLVCTAIAAAGMSSAWFGSFAHAASSKRAAAAQKSRDQREQKQKDASELHADDKSMKKQLQWEDKVMGPDSKRAELDKIARAHAINEKAEKDKEKQAALEAAAPAPKPEKAKKAEVALPSMSDEKPSARASADEGRAHEISPKLETAAAQAPVPASKPADDKFIDKLLREEDAPSKKRASANDKSDKELESLLAGAKDKPAAGRKRADSVDSLLKNADKGPAMPAPRAQSGLPEWAKQPEIASSAAPPQPVALRTTSPRNDGVIHVTQGAAVASVAPAPTRTAPPARGARRGAKASPVEWNDPFAEKKAPSYATAEPKKVTASHPAAMPNAATSGSWNDPFADGADAHKTTTRRAAPAVSPTPATPARHNDKANDSGRAPAQGGWKDPFTKAPSEPTHTPVAMRELGKNESSKWEIATHHGSSSSSSHTGSDAHASGGWGVIKKRAR